MNNRQTNNKRTKNQFRTFVNEQISESKRNHRKVKRVRSPDKMKEKEERRLCFMERKEYGKDLKRHSLFKRRGGRNHWGRKVVKFDMNVLGL